MTKKNKFHFNHIDSNIEEEKLRQIKDLYLYYHKINYAVNILSILLASTGVITGGITLNPTVLSVLITAGTL